MNYRDFGIELIFDHYVAAVIFLFNSGGFMSKNNSGLLQSFLNLPSTALEGIGKFSKGMINAATGFFESITEMLTARKHTLDTLKINHEHDLARQRIESEYARESKRLDSGVEKERLRSLKITLLKRIEAQKTVFIRMIEKDEKVELAWIDANLKTRLAEINKEEKTIIAILGILKISAERDQPLDHDMKQLCFRALETTSSIPLPSQLPPLPPVRSKEVTFSFYLPNNEYKPSLIGEFTEWKNWRMVNSGNNNWCLTVSLPPGDYQYGFHIYPSLEPKYDQLIVSVPEDENTNVFVFGYEDCFPTSFLSFVNEEEKMWVTGDFVGWRKKSDSRLMSKDDDFYHVTYSFTATKAEYQFKFFGHANGLDNFPASSRWIPDSAPNLKLKITKGRSTGLQSRMTLLGSQAYLQSRSSRLPTNTLEYHR